MVRRRKIVFIDNVVNFTENNKAQNTETELSEFDLDDLDVEDTIDYTVVKDECKLKNLVMEESEKTLPELIGVFGNNYEK